MDMLSYLDNNPSSFDKVQNEVYKVRDSFHIGKVMQANSDYTFDIKSIRQEETTSVTVMGGINEKPRVGDAVLFLAGNEKTATQILGRSCFIIGD